MIQYEINPANVLYVGHRSDYRFNVYFDKEHILEGQDTNPLSPKSLEDLIAHLDDAELCQLQRVITLRQI